MPSGAVNAYNPPVDENALARRAVERRVVTEEQLREARSFAEGGRSLLSVLLDLGYLREDQLPGLLEPPPVPAPCRSLHLPRLALAAALSFLLGWFGHPPASRPSDPPPILRENEQLRQAIARTEREMAILRSRISEQNLRSPSRLRTLGRRGLEEAEIRLRKDGRLTPENRDLFLRGAVLLEAAEDEESLEEPEELMLGRAWEILQKWDPAYARYSRVLQKNPRHPKALLGAARAALEQEDLVAALQHAAEAVRQTPSGEAHLLLGRAEMRAGRKDQARLDLLRARELDPSLAPLVANLLDRLPRE